MTDELMRIEHWYSDTDSAVLQYLGRREGENTCPSATLSTTNPTWTGMGLNLVLSEKPATNHLCNGTDFITEI